MIVHVHESEPRWTSKLADILEQAKMGDIIVVSSYEVLELAENAAKRMNKWPAVRIMTEQTYATLKPKSGPDRRA